MLVVTNLQKRLLSSIEAFACTLKVHRTAIERQTNKNLNQRTSNYNLLEESPGGDDDRAELRTAIERQTNKNLNQRTSNYNLLEESPGGDDDRAELPETEVQQEEDAQMRAATKQTGVGVTEEELQLLTEMTDIANAARYQPDCRIKYLTEWLRENICPKLGETEAEWLDRRVLIFTEYADTKRYLLQQLETAISHSHQAEKRIGVFHGGMGDKNREEIALAFNADPKNHPLRILIATDAAREGINLQNYCANLFHFDIPWNPSRMEQRNGRIDRKLQREPVVYCHYFVLPQRAEDQVLDVLVKKTATIHRELGSLTPVVEKNITRLLQTGIAKVELEKLKSSINNIDGKDTPDSIKQQTIQEELEISLPETKALKRQLEELQTILKSSQEWLGLDDRHFRDAISASLEILGVEPLQPIDPNEAAQDPTTTRWEIPSLDQRVAADPTWVVTLDSLRTPRKQGQKPWEWRQEATIRPVIFRDPGSLDGDVVHLHLEHRVVQRLLGRFLAQGFLHDEFTRACVCLTDNAMPKVIALGRLSIYGEGAARLHDEIIAVAAEWIDPDNRGRKKLKPLTQGDKDNVLELLENSLASPRLRQVSEGVKKRLQKIAAQDVGELIPHLDKRAEKLAASAEKKLTARGRKEAEDMKRILHEQRSRILEQQEETKAVQLELDLFSTDEKKQIDADRRYWVKRLEMLGQEIETEPTRIQATYRIKATRVEPVGLVYLWPVSS